MHDDPSLSRRDFLRLASLAPALALAPSLLRGATSDATATARPATAVKTAPIGLELYSVRNELARDLPGTLQAVAGMGYEAVEFYAPYFEWTPAFAKDVRRQMDELGLRCLSTHNHIEAFTPGAGLAKAIELNHILGAHIIVMASAPGDIKTADDWNRLSGKLSDAVAKFVPEGLTAGYHNHQAEWARIDGDRRIIDIIAANTPHEFVLQLDVGTCLEAGQDPVAWIHANPGRIRAVHLKDWAPGDAKDERGYRVLFGEGSAPWPGIIEAAETVGGVEVFLLEQEGSRFSEFETARRCLSSWRALRAGARA